MQKHISLHDLRRCDCRAAGWIFPGLHQYILTYFAKINYKQPQVTNKPELELLDDAFANATTCYLYLVVNSGVCYIIKVTYCADAIGGWDL